MSGHRIALVTQRFGPGVNGGSEDLCAQVGRHLAHRNDVEILTTCALDYRTWADHFPSGVERSGGLTVKRFPVAHPRHHESFRHICAALEPRPRSISRDEAESWLWQQGPASSELIAHLAREGQGYDAVVFFTYLYATAYFGLPHVAERSILVPTAHDEWPIHLPVWDSWFRLPRRFVFMTLEEERFLGQRFPGQPLPGVISGLGIDDPPPADEERFRRAFSLNGPYLLYVGRVDAIKGVKNLIDQFLHYLSETRSDLTLVLMGSRVGEFPEHPSLRYTGFADEQTKHDAIAGCLALVNPSHLESLSIVLLEAWARGRPTIVNADSPVMVGQSQRSQGGLWYHDYLHFRSCIDVVRQNPGFAAPAARWVLERYRWETIVGHYEQAVEAVIAAQDAKGRP